MLFSKPLTYGEGNTLRRIVAGFLLLLVFLLPIQNVLTTPVVSVAQAQTTGTSASASFCSEASTCLTSIVYLFAVYIPTNFAYAAGYLFNAALQLALNSASYALNFLSLGWTIVRDIANLTFIFILIYIAYIIIMRAESSGTMKMLAWVIAMALLINFSFFITRMVIDAGNILSVQFYNAINIPNSIPSPLGTQQCPPNCIKDLTGGIMDAVKVQGILGDKSFAAFMASSGNSLGSFGTNVLVQTLVFVSVGIFLSLLGFVFLIVGIKFMVRIVVLWLTIVASPLAFAAHALPNNKKVMGYYQMWQDNLIQSAFFPAIFLFLFFIMNLFLQALAGGKGLVPDIFNAVAQINTSGAGNVEAGISVIANVGVRMGLVIVLLYFAMKASDSFSAMGSGMANSVTSWAGSKAANMTAGTSSWLARNSAGRLANTAARSATVRDWAAKNPLYGGRLVSGALNKAATSSLDVRGIGGLKSLVGKAGFDLNGPGGKGGYRKQEADRAHDAEKFAKGLKSDAVYVKKNALTAGLSAYDKANGKGSVAELEKIQAQGAAAAIQQYAAQYDANRAAGDMSFKEKLDNLEKARVLATKDAESHKTAGNTVEEAKARAAAAAASQAFASEDAKSKQKYADAVKDLSAMRKLGEVSIKEADKKRIYGAADYEESRRFGNMYMPSVGNIEGADHMRHVMHEKSDKEKLKDLAAKVALADQAPPAPVAQTPTPTAPSGGGSKPTPPPSGGDHGNDHGAGHHMTFKAMRTEAQKPGGLKGSTEALHNEVFGEDMLKRLDARMRNIQENTSAQGAQMGNIQQSIDILSRAAQRQTPSTPTGPTTYGDIAAGKGAMRPKTPGDNQQKPPRA